MLSAASTAPSPAGPQRRVKTLSLAELGQRTDALALAVGARATASALLVACVIMILVGAQSLLSTMEGMDRDIKEMSKQLAIANVGLVILNDTMDSVPPTSRHLAAIVGVVDETSKQVKVSSANIGGVADTTSELSGHLTAIASSTGSMRASLESAGSGTAELETTITSLNTNIAPLVKTQHQMLLGTRRMRGGLDNMNASLAYTIRIMNYIAAPPTGGGMTIRADLPKETLPPIPGIRAEVKPVPVFPRNIWPVYTGP